MNHKELQALRKLLMLDTSEAAEHVGEVKARTWYYWEEGKNPIPPEVAGSMLDLERMRKMRIEKARKQIHDGGKLKYHTRYEDYNVDPDTPSGQHSVVSWRISQSVAAHFYAEGLADLI